MPPATLSDLTTPAAVVDLDRVLANLDRMAEYTRNRGLALRPHVKTHKVPELARTQVARGAVGVTVATLREAGVMAAVVDDILIAYPPVGTARLRGLMALPEHVRLTVGLDSVEALDGLSAAARQARRKVGVLVELDLGMRRVGLPEAESAVALARCAADAPGIDYRGVMFYPGHIRQPVPAQGEALRELALGLAARLDALAGAGLAPSVVSGGSTPTAFVSHVIEGVTEVRPGTYIYNDRTTAEIGACRSEDLAFTVLATVVSTAVPGQAVVDAGSKAIGREPLRAGDGGGFGALLDRPDVTVRAMSEEHGILDLSATDWSPRVGELVRIVPNHVCYAVNLHPRVWTVRGDRIESAWDVAARGWTP